MKLSIKSFQIGDRVFYRFPTPTGERDVFVGTVQRKGKKYIELENPEQLKLTLCTVHLENIESVERLQYSGAA